MSFIPVDYTTEVRDYKNDNIAVSINLIKNTSFSNLKQFYTCWITFWIVF